MTHHKEKLPEVIISWIEEQLKDQELLKNSSLNKGKYCLEFDTHDDFYLNIVTIRESTKLYLETDGLFMDIKIDDKQKSRIFDALYPKQ